MHTFIHIFYFNDLGESALLCGQTVPEAIHNQVAIKFLKSYNMLCIPVFLHLGRF